MQEQARTPSTGVSRVRITGAYHGRVSRVRIAGAYHGRITGMYHGHIMGVAATHAQAHVAAPKAGAVTCVDLRVGEQIAHTLYVDDNLGA